MKLIEIGETGNLSDEVSLDDHLNAIVVEATVDHYRRTGFARPWIGYVAVKEDAPVGACGFKSSPVNGRVEIAYGTFSGHEGQGIGTAMARELLRIVSQADASLTVFAQTLPEENASTSILKKLGFTLTGSVEHPEDGTVWEWELGRPESAEQR